MSEFIFMLTHDDATVPNAHDVLTGLLGSGLRYVGFKDVGAQPSVLKRLASLAHEAGIEVMLEIVSTSEETELKSLRSALEIGVDWVLGGTHPDKGVEILRDANVHYCPFPGTVVGHPSVLEGEVAEIAAHARRLGEMEGVHGLDLLAYRHQSVQPVALIRAVRDVLDGPVIVAGSIASPAQIVDVGRTGAWGFTIGSAIFESRLPGDQSIAGQVAAVLEIAQNSASQPAVE